MKRLIIILFLLVPAIAHAEEIKYAEFTSRLSSESINVSEENTPSQNFKPLNDSISGTDLWIDNVGVAGLLTVNLRRESDDQILTSKAVSVPKISSTWGGEQFHISFNSPVALASTNIYKIEVVSSMPDLRMYYSDIVAIQQHASSYSIGDIVEPAYLGLDEQDFAFHFALYEKNDSYPPVISNVSVEVVSPNETELSFHANEPVDYRIILSPEGGTDFKGIYTQCNVGLNACTLSVTTKPGTDYDYELVAKDEWGNETTKSGSFASLEDESADGDGGEEAEESLAISNAHAHSIISNSASVSWTTNIAANSNLVVSILKGAELHAVLGLNSSVYELEHLLKTGSVLNPSTKYFAEITSFDTSGESVKENLTFTTLASAPDGEEEEEEETPSETDEETNPPVPEDMDEDRGNSEISVSIDTSGGNGAIVLLGWNVPEEGAPSDGYRIDIFDADNNLKLSITSDTNSVEIGDLDPGEYHAVVYSNNGGVFERIGDPIHFTIPGLTKTISYKTRVYSIIVISVIALALSLVMMDLRRKSREKGRRKKKGSQNENGVTLLELVISVAILASAITLIGIFGRDVTNLGVNFTQRFETQQEISITINEMIREIRSVMPSNEGSYAIAAASGNSMTFYTDIKGDGLVEQVRYFLDGDILKKGVIEPSGNPLTYNLGDEVVGEVVHNIVTGTSTIFSYYDENFTGSESPLTIPVTISDIRMIEVNLAAKEEGQAAPITFTFQITPRNLRSNL